MTTSDTGRPARTALPELDSREASSISWTGTLRLGNGVDALSLPVGHAGAVTSRLARAMFSPVVLSWPGPWPRWVFLTGQATPLSLDDLVRLDLVGAYILPAGHELALPPGQVQDRPVRWVLPPHPGLDLPLWQAVVNAALGQT